MADFIMELEYKFLVPLLALLVLLFFLFVIFIKNLDSNKEQPYNYDHNRTCVTEVCYA